MLKKPQQLKKGDSIAIVATARKVEPEEISAALSVFRSWGLRVVLGQNLFNNHNQFAGSDQDRQSDLQEMLDNPEIRAVICARGGYGTTRIIDDIDFSQFEKSPKWVVGFSDITVLLYQLNAFGYEAIHGIMAGLFNKEGVTESIESLRVLLFGEAYRIDAQFNPLNRMGAGAGNVVGGNLSIINNIIGTKSDLDMSGKILFIEDLDEYLYHIDRMMVHLKRAGKIQNLAGLVVGGMSDMRDNAIPFGKNAYEIILEHVESFNYPVGFNFPIGHEAQNLAVPCGRHAELEVQKNGSSLRF